MFTSLQTLRTHRLHFQYDVSNVPSHTEHVKRSLETSKIEKKAKICWFSGFAAITKTKKRKVPLSQEESIFFKILSTAFLSTWMQTYLRLTSLNVDLVRRNFDFCVFLVYIGPKNGPAVPKINLSVPLSPREINIFQNPFNSIFLNLNANWF